MGKDKHKTIENIGVSIGASCHEVILDSRPYLGAEHSGNPPIVGVRIMPSHPLFPLLFLFIARPPVLSTTLNCIIMPHDYYDNTWHVPMVKIPCIGYNS